MSPSNEREFERLAELLRVLMERAEREKSRGAAEIRLSWGRDGAVEGELRGNMEFFRRFLRESA